MITNCPRVLLLCLLGACLLQLGFGCRQARLPTKGGGPNGFLCACDENYCDTVEPLGSLGPQDIVVYQTEIDRDRLARYTTQYKPSADPKMTSATEISFNPNQRYQTILGFGGAFTDAAAINFYKFSPGLQNKFLEAYFSKAGLEYSVGRIPIASTDFSTHVYSYNDSPDDYNMVYFTIQPDYDSGKIPMIRRACDAAGRNLTFFGSPWAPPVWMTTQNTAVHCYLKDAPGGLIHKSYARYLSRFVTEYEKAHIPIWGITAQNEPLSNVAWQSLQFTAEQQRDFILYDLGPQLRADHPNLKLMAYDDQRNNLGAWADTLMANGDVANYVDGFAVHWYAAVEDSFDNFHYLVDTHNKHPNKFILGTEACEGYLPWSHGVYPGDWPRAGTYAHDIIGDLNSWAVGWTDWNLLLDMNGGPNWANNVVDAPIFGNSSVFFKQPMFYYLGHFSKFIPPGSVRIALSLSNGDVEGTAVLTPQNLIVIVLLNRGVVINRDVTIKVANKGYIHLTVPHLGMQTVIFQN